MADQLFEDMIPASSLLSIGGLRDPNTADYQFNFVSSYLFNRAYALTLQPAGFVATVAQQFSNQLRVEFDIIKNSFSTSNKSTIKIYNLSSDSRSKYTKGSLLILKAGYATTIDTIFRGVCTGRVMNERKGADIITSFEFGDSEKEIFYTYFSQSYPALTPVIRVVNDLVQAMGVTLGSVSGIPETAIYSKGFTACGNVKKYLDNIAKTYNLQWSIQNGALQILPKGAALLQSAVVISKGTGLIGIPSQGNGGDNITTFTSLLNPKLVPNSLVSLVSDNFTGIFTIKNAKFEGDTHGNKWQTVCECTEVNNAVAINVPQNVGNQIV